MTSSSDPTAIRERVAAADRAWFKRHRTKRHRLRRLVPGEFATDVSRAVAHSDKVRQLETVGNAAAAEAELAALPEGEAALVLVTRIKGGRKRVPFVFPDAIAVHRRDIPQRDLATLEREGWLPMDWFAGASAD